MTPSAPRAARGSSSIGARARPETLAEALAFLREGDVLAVWKLDRLGRSMRDLVRTVEDLDGRDVGLRSLTGCAQRDASVAATLQAILADLDATPDGAIGGSAAAARTNARARPPTSLRC